MKSKLIGVILLFLLGIAVTLKIFSGMAGERSYYANEIAAAQKSAEEEIPYMAVQHYQAAFQVQCSDEAEYQKYMEQAKLVDENFYATAIEEYTKYFPGSAQAYEQLCTYYYDNENYDRVVTLALEARDKGIATEKVRDLYMECAYQYQYIKSGFEEVTSFLGDYARVKADGLYGFLNSSGSYLLAPSYEEASFFLDSFTAVKKDNECYMINMGGYKVAKPDQPLESLSLLSNGFALAKKDGKYGYVTSVLQIPEKFEYEDATVYKNGVAAVKKDGKWALIDSEQNNITEAVFDDVILDEYGACIDEGVIFAKEGKEYYMYDAEGNKISEQGFDDAYPFQDSEPAAVCIDKKWGFIDQTGKIVIEPEYEQAKSFGLGLAPVKKNGKWSYIDPDKEVRVEGDFTDCMPFTANGIAAVEEDGVWGFIKLNMYQ